MSVTHVPAGFTRDSWEVTWMNVALDISRRSACTKAQCGAVIITPDNRLAGLGYNGPPRGLAVSCGEACPRAKKNESDDTYDTCISVHAELNAVMHSSVADRRGATLYVTTTMCMTCTKIVANSGVKRVVMRVRAGDAHRMPERTIAFLQACQLDVQVWDAGIAPYRRAFFESHGIGPHNCYFCSDLLAWVEAVHHLDHNHDNNDPANLVPSHAGCHARHHNEDRGLSQATIDKIHGPKVSCPTCGKISTRMGLARHRSAKNH